MNAELEDAPELVNKDPYGEGWIIKIAVQNPKNSTTFFQPNNTKTLSANNQHIKGMKPVVSIIMGSTSDLPIMEKAAQFFEDMEIPFEMNALSAHRTPEAVEQFAKDAYARGIQVIIAAAGMAAHLPGVIASMTTLPVIGVPINSSLEGMDALLAMVQMPPGVPVATVGINGALNAAILALQIISEMMNNCNKVVDYKAGLKTKSPKQTKNWLP